MLHGNLNSFQHLGVMAADMDAAIAWYTDKLGFSPTYETTINLGSGDVRLAFLDRGGVVLELIQHSGAALDEVKTRAHGNIDHFAIDTLDIDAALADALARGATLHASTPDGVVTLPDLGPRGTRYVFLHGPTGEKVELAQSLHLDAARRARNLDGWNHLGIFVTDLARSKAFYEQFGFAEVLAGEIGSGDDRVRLSFVGKDGFVLELVQLPAADLPEVAARQAGLIDHVALDVNDIDAAYAELQAAGMTMLQPAPVPVPLYEKGVRFFMIAGPDGEKVEFNQVLK